MDFRYVAFGLLGGFIIMMSTLVYKSVSTDFYLVTDKYYEEGVNYDATQAKLTNVDNLHEKVTANIVENNVIIQIPTQVSEGKIVLYRPADGTKDISLDIVKDQSLVTYDATKMDKGKWIAKIEWQNGDQKYYAEKSFFINE